MRKLLFILFLVAFLPHFAQATFPTIATTNSGNSAAQVTSHTVNLPASIANGDLLVAILVVDTDVGAMGTFTWPSGWADLGGDSGPSGVDLETNIRFKRADGTEGASISVTTSGPARGSAHATYRITGHHTTTDPEISNTDGGSTTAGNPPTLTASWGAEDNLWIVMTGWEDAAQTVTGWPTNYSLSNAQDRWNDANGQGVAIGARELNTNTQDPPAFTMSGAPVRTTAHTLVVRPAAVGGGTQRRPSPMFFQ